MVGAIRRGRWSFRAAQVPVEPVRGDGYLGARIGRLIALTLELRHGTHQGKQLIADLMICG